jgi:excisionase family DNA binding protein
MKPKSEPLLTLQNLSEDWRVSPKSVRRLIAKGELKVVRIGHQIRIHPDDKAAYERRHRS